MILDGKQTRNKKMEILEEEIKNLEVKPGLAVIQVGDHPASNIYIRQKKNLAEKLGMYFEHIKLEEDVERSLLEETINELNKREEIHGIIVQLPLPKRLNKDYFLNLIDPDKDVDGLTYMNQGKLQEGRAKLMPCTPKGVMELLKEYGIEIASKKVVVIGRSTLVGKPVAALLLNENATISICHSKTENISEYTRQADIVVVAVGKPYFLKANMVKEGVVVIDVGINRLEDGRLVGDVDFENVKEKSSFITPVPGGVGPMTVAMLMENTYEAYKLQNEKILKLKK